MLKADLRRQVVEHERRSRANQGKPQFPLSMKLKQALPLVGIVITLYIWSFSYIKRRQHPPDIRQPATILKDVREIFAPEERTGEPGPRTPEPVYVNATKNPGGSVDDLLIDDLNKKW